MRAEKDLMRCIRQKNLYGQEGGYPRRGGLGARRVCFSGTSSPEAEAAGGGWEGGCGGIEEMRGKM